MGLYLSKKKTEDKINELNVREVYIYESEEKFKIKQIEFEEKFKLLDVLNKTNDASYKDLIILYSKLTLKLTEFDEKKKILFTKLTEYHKQKNLAVVLFKQIEFIGTLSNTVDAKSQDASQSTL